MTSAKAACRAKATTTWLIFTFGNGVPMRLRAARPSSRRTAGRCAWSTCAAGAAHHDAFIQQQAASAKRNLVVDAGGAAPAWARASSPRGRGRIGALAALRVVGAGHVHAAAGAAFLVIPSEPRSWLPQTAWPCRAVARRGASHVAR